MPARSYADGCEERRPSHNHVLQVSIGSQRSALSTDAEAGSGALIPADGHALRVMIISQGLLCRACTWDCYAAHAPGPHPAPHQRSPSPSTCRARARLQGRGASCTGQQEATCRLGTRPGGTLEARGQEASERQYIQARRHGLAIKRKPNRGRWCPPQARNLLERRQRQTASHRTTSQAAALGGGGVGACCTTPARCMYKPTAPQNDSERARAGAACPQAAASG